MFIAYDSKSGIEYAKLCESKREGQKVSKKYVNLGRVLDKKNNIFQNRERGVFVYNLASNLYENPPENFVPKVKKCNRKESLILDFGDTFFLDNFIRKNGLNDVINSLGYGNSDTLYSMLNYYVLCNMANCHAEDWWEGNYARILYPNANLSSQRISGFLASIGSENSQRLFFKEYFKLLSNTGIDAKNVLIDSTGLPNDIHFPLNALVSRNGKINNEVRLIYVVHQKTGLPIYFRYCAGNIVDSMTLIRCLEELKSQGVDVNFSILDAGYYTVENLREMFEKKISFLTRMTTNLGQYKKLISEHFESLQIKENLVEYNGRFVYLKCVKFDFEGHNAFAYIGLDIERKSMEIDKVFRRAKDSKMNAKQVFDAMEKLGAFILVSSRRIAKEKILPLYYTRQQIEQVFDIGKNYATLLPVRVHSEETFRGHLVLTFLATVIIKLIQAELLKTSVNPISLFCNLRNQKCKVFDDKIVSGEAFKRVNDCYKLFKIQCPSVIRR